MSKLYQSYQGSSEPSPGWYLKESDGTVYGPVDLPSLCEWAATGRIMAGHMVSSDRQTWVPAETVAALKMLWVARLKNGQPFGPFHIAAVPHLVQHRKLARGTSIQNISTGASLSVSSILAAGADVGTLAAAQGERTETAAQEAVIAPPAIAEPAPVIETKQELPETKPAGPAIELQPAAPAVVPRVEPGPVAETSDSSEKDRQILELGDRLRSASERLLDAERGLLEEKTLRQKLQEEFKDKEVAFVQTMGASTSRLADTEKAREVQERALQERVRALEAELAAKGRQVADLETVLEQERAARAELADKARSGEQQLVAQVEQMRAEGISAGERIKGLAEELDRARDAAEAMKAEGEARLGELRGRIAELERTAAESETVLGALETEIADAARRQAELEAQAAERENALADAKTELARFQADRTESMQTVPEPSKSGERKWYLKGDDQGVYGPIGLSDLWDWACQCRIGPLHQVSQDQATWISVQDIPWLRIEWLAALPNGRILGPLNPFAFRELVADGQISPDAAALNRRTGETMSTAKLLKSIEEAR